MIPPPVKTPAGIEEIRTRRGGLSLIRRRLLIMIDGTRTVDELAQLTPGEDIWACLAELQERGLIDATATLSAPRSAAPKTVPPRPPTLTGAVNTVGEARRRAVAKVNELLGPDGTDLAIAIERCVDGDELRQRIREADVIISAALGPAASAAFINAVRGRG